MHIELSLFVRSLLQKNVFPAAEKTIKSTFQRSFTLCHLFSPYLRGFNGVSIRILETAMEKFCNI